jgi:hypothetical protein
LKKRIALLVLLGSLAGLCAAAEPPPILIHVVDGRGRPVAGATVHAAADSETVLQEKTGADGTVRLSGLPDDRLVWVLAERRGLSPALQSFSGAAKARREQRIVLAPGTLAVGRVMDEKGRPVVGAEAELTGEVFGLPSTSFLPAFLRERPKVRTGPAGRFRFRDLPAGRYELRLRHPAFAPLVAEHPVQGGRGGDLGRFVLRRGAVLTGTVTDPDGRPVAGLPLWVATGLSIPATPLPPSSAITGTDGSFAIPGLPLEEQTLFTCGKEVHPVSVPVRFVDEPVHLTVRPAATLRGRVLGPDGEPLAGASLSARRVGGLAPDSFDWSLCRLQDETVSDADGRFVVGPLDAGWYDLLADVLGMKLGTLRMLRAAAGEPGEELEIRLEAGGTLSGRVLDETGTPVAGADLSLDGPWTSMTKSDREGSFSLDISFEEPAPAVLSAEMCGYETVRRELEDLAGELRIDLVLARGGDCTTIRGRVAGPDGAPVERALVARDYFAEQAWTAADGTFELSPGKGIRQITVKKPGFAEARLEVDPEEGPLDNLEIRLERGAVISGHLLGLSEEDRRRMISVLLIRPSASAPPLQVAAVRNGTFRIEDVPSGTLRLDAWVGALLATRTVTMEPGQAELSVDLEVQPAHTVSGQVLDDRAQPVAGATITVAMGERSRTIDDSGTRADGSFALRLPDGSFSLYAFKDGFLEMGTGLDVMVDGGAETGLEMRLEPATILRGRLFGLAPGERPQIRMGGPGSVPAHVELDRFTVEDLQAGEWVIEASLNGAEGQRVLRRAIEIPPGITDLEVDLDFAEAELEAIEKVTEEEP